MNIKRFFEPVAGALADDLKSLHASERLRALAAQSYRKHFGPHAIAAAEGDLLGEALEAIRAALGAIENTLRARGYSNGECTDSWSSDVRNEVATSRSEEHTSELQSLLRKSYAGC